MSDRAKLEEAISAVAGYEPSGHWFPIIEAARAHLATLPKTKKRETWHVEYVDRRGKLRVDVELSAIEAHARWEDLIEGAAIDGFACIRVTGPHMQEVPS